MRRFFIPSCSLFLLSAGVQALAASPPPAVPDPFILPQTRILPLTQKNDAWDARIGKGRSMHDPIPRVRLTHAPYTRLIDLPQQGYAYIRF